MLNGTGLRMDESPSLVSLVHGQGWRAAAIAFASVGGWLFLVWLATDMEAPLAQLAMPMSADWSAANVLAVGAMWSGMMVAMMLPAALPMVLTFAELSRGTGDRARTEAFIAAYVLAWLAFGLAGAGAQWSLQALGWLDAMQLSTSRWVSAMLLVIAALYQFSPLKRVCLKSCRTPVGFLIGEWRPGVRGAFVMGLRHGMLCLGCCWALMLLLFAGGVMNVYWVAALAIAVAVEKLAPGGDRISFVLGVLLLMAGVIRLVV